MLAFKSVVGTKFTVEPVVDTVPATVTVPSFSVNVEVETSAPLLKVAATTGLIATVSALLAGEVAAITACDPIVLVVAGSLTVNKYCQHHKSNG